MSAENSSPVTLSDRERSAVIAALRLWQLWQGDKVVMFGDDGVFLESIADEHGPGLTNDEIDALVERKFNV